MGKQDNKYKDIWAAIQKQHGAEGLFMGNENMTTYSEAISTGSHTLDDALGIWGVPKGHIVQYAGFESSGKTMLSLSTIAEWQKKDPKNWALFVDAELSFDSQWAELIGVDTSRLMVYRENKADKIFEMLVGRPASKLTSIGEVKTVKTGLLDMEIAAGPGGTGLGVIVIDSIAQMQPPTEQVRGMEQQEIAVMARFLPKALRRITPLLTKTGVTLIAINQLRYKTDVMYGDPTDSPGGTALKFACAQMINLAKIKNKESNIENSDSDIIGHHIRAKVQKNKKAAPHRVAELAIEYLKGVVHSNIEVKNIGIRYGIIERPNNVTYILDGVKYKGKDAIGQALMDDDLRNSVLDRSKEVKKQRDAGIDKPIATTIEEEGK